MSDPSVVPVVLAFDVEPDEIEVAMEPRPWLGFERLVERIGGIRELFAAATGRPVAFNWFVRMDPQIATSHGRAGWVADRYGDRLAALREAGDEIGLHPHAWRWSAGRWVADHADAAWVDECVRVSFETYEAAMGTPCRSTRFGDRFLSARAIGLAAQLGARYDLTVEPGAHGTRALHPGVAATGRIPGHTGAPREPYRPSADDPLLPATNGADAGLWMIPLTSVDSDRLVPSWRRLGRRVKHPLGPRHRPAPLEAPWDAVGYWQVIEAHVDGARRPYLAFAIRTDAVIDPPRAQAIRLKRDALARSPLAGRLLMTTPEAVIARLAAP